MQGETLEVTLTTKVVGIGIIENIATVNVNDYDFTTNDPSTNWGAVEILKYAHDDKTATLDGAVFDVYASAADAAVGTNPVLMGVTTGPDGTVVIDGLWVGNNDDVTKQYWIVETQAPTGYQLPSNPVFEVTVTANGTAIVNLDIANDQQPSVGLPLTGAQGTLILTLSSLGLLSIAVGATLVNRRRKVQA